MIVAVVVEELETLFLSSVVEILYTIMHDQLHLQKT